MENTTLYFVLDNNYDINDQYQEGQAMCCFAVEPNSKKSAYIFLSLIIEGPFLLKGPWAYLISYILNFKNGKHTVEIIQEWKLWVFRPVLVHMSFHSSGIYSLNSIEKFLHNTFSYDTLTW